MGTGSSNDNPAGEAKDVNRNKLETRFALPSVLRFIVATASFGHLTRARK
jgi:hypothetical protein